MSLCPDKVSEVVRVTWARSLYTVAEVTGASTIATAAPEADAKNSNGASMPRGYPESVR